MRDVEPVQALLVVVASASASAALSYGALSWLTARGVMDRPNHRSSHAMPTPRGGGMAPVAVILTVLGWLAWSGGPPGWGVAAAVLWVAAVSLADDLKDVPWWARFASQAGAVALALASVRPASLFLGPGFELADLLILGVAWMWFLNLYNFMDGIDGLAAGEAVMVALGVAVLLLALGAETRALVPALAVAGAAAGFLCWNWQPARMFMGDVGSVTLGFVIGYLLIDIAGRGALAAAFILPGYFLVDASWTLTRRLLRGERVWQAHRTHAYQRAVQAGWSHRRTVLAILALNVILVALALWSLAQPLAALALALTLCAALRGYLSSLAPAA